MTRVAPLTNGPRVIRDDLRRLMKPEALHGYLNGHRDVVGAIGTMKSYNKELPLRTGGPYGGSGNRPSICASRSVS